MLSRLLDEQMLKEIGRHYLEMRMGQKWTEKRERDEVEDGLGSSIWLKRHVLIRNPAENGEIDNHLIRNRLSGSGPRDNSQLLLFCACRVVHDIYIPLAQFRPDPNRYILSLIRFVPYWIFALICLFLALAHHHFRITQRLDSRRS